MRPRKLIYTYAGKSTEEVFWPGDPSSDFVDRVRFVRDVCGLKVQCFRLEAGAWVARRAPRAIK